ncbi:MAG: hypothetical protein M3198_02440 [Actinomycetota bacterium]|nr:hypothetical protein [Actinomycetota bacterium]
MTLRWLRVALLCPLLVLAGGLTIGSGAWAKVPDDTGHGSGARGTGHARACRSHVENKGNSYAKGLECAPTLIVTVLGASGPFTCSVRFTGTGLEPGTFVTVHRLVQPTISFEVGPVGTNGVLDVTQNIFNSPAALVATATTVPQEAVQVIFTSAC